MPAIQGFRVSLHRLKPLRPALCAAAVIAIVAAAGPSFGFRCNLTDSAPLGIWMEDRHSAWAVGDYAFVCPPLDAPIISVALARNYLPMGDCPGAVAPLLKVIAAGPGETVSLTHETVQVGMAPPIHAVSLDQDSAGRPLPHALPGIYRLGAHQYWLLSVANARSIDSRYFGPVAQAAVIAVARPILTLDLSRGRPQ